MAEAARVQFGLDGVWWIPAGRSPHKLDREHSPMKHRLAMTRLAVEEHAAFQVSDMEAHRNGPSFTVDTVRAVYEAHPEYRLFLLLGEDNWEQFMTWRGPGVIRAMARLVVCPRRGAMNTSDSEAGTLFVNAPLVDITASGIRRRVRDGRSIRDLVSESVGAYIDRYRLYKAA